jgi:hypothetical protein
MFVDMLDSNSVLFEIKFSCKIDYYCSVEGQKLGYRLDGPSFGFI